MSEKQVLRIGKISSLNYAKGTARVTYEDRGGDTTTELPFLAWEYWMPRVADQVLVGHLSNGTASAVILGPVWNSSHRPYSSGAGVFRKEMHTTKNKAVILYTGNDGLLKLRAEHIAFEAYEDSVYVTVQDIQDDFNAMSNLTQAVGRLQDQVKDLEDQMEALQNSYAELENRVSALGG